MGHKEHPGSEIRDAKSVIRDFVRTDGIPLHEQAATDLILRQAEGKSLVLLGKESHSTQEYYEQMTELSKRLITEQEHTFVGIEWDWADTQKLNDYVHGQGAFETAEEALDDFSRWPMWMWGNESFAPFVEWLREYNLGSATTHTQQVSIYGLDCQDEPDIIAHHTSLTNLHEISPESLIPLAARDLVEVSYPQAHTLLKQAGKEIRDAREVFRERFDEDEYFQTLHGLTVADVARAYLAIDDNWDIRERGMAQTTSAIMKHHGKDARGVLWEHNTHVGDRRYAGNEKDLSMGELMRRRYGKSNLLLVGMGSYSGTVIAQNPLVHGDMIMPVATHNTESWGNVLHEARPHENYAVVFDSKARNEAALHEQRGQRAVGIAYHPFFTLYVPTDIAQRYDAFIHFADSHAVKPLPSVLHGESLEIWKPPVHMPDMPAR